MGLRVPSSTYRIQLNREFRFADAERLVPYFDSIGITHLYLSPCLRARPGSRHGYDIVSHSELNPELGSADDFFRLVRAVKARSMGLIFDIVPNHMGILGNLNVWWNDVLENGPASLYAKHFDIDWNFSVKPELREKVLLPILGKTYGETLESGELKLSYREGQFAVEYYEHRFPIDVCTLGPFLGEVLLSSGTDETALEGQSILTAIRNLPSRSEIELPRIEERIREKEVIRRRLHTLIQRESTIQSALAARIARYNGCPRDDASFDLLDELLNSQAYRLSYFRVAADEINYRRFFDVNELAALSVERPEVFAETHALICSLIAQGVIDGLRVDHVDGLYDPLAYLKSLRNAVEGVAGEQGNRLYFVVEKILGEEEFLPEAWPVDGTTGYELLSSINAVFVDQSAEKEFNRIYARWSSGMPKFSEVAYRCKEEIQRTALASELHVLAQQLDRLSECNRHSRDFTFAALTWALRDVIAYFPIYRSYIDDNDISRVDEKYVVFAVQKAKRKNPAVHGSLFDFILHTLLLKLPMNSGADYAAAQLTFVRKFQQLTSAVAAKGVEDTAFYLYNRLLSLNEVGSNPDTFGISVETFHQRMTERQRRSPAALSPLATHDTKRGEDTRARLNVLSEIPEEFAKTLSHFERLNRRFAVKQEAGIVPGKNLLYLFYQTLVAIWPAGSALSSLENIRARVDSFMQKAIHEAKEHTSWINPDPRYDSAVSSYVTRVLDPSNERFFRELRRFVSRIARAGYINSLSQSILRICGPGTPDTYQGTELWDLSLVDPDNRRAVDYEQRNSRLEELDEMLLKIERVSVLRDLQQRADDGTIKLFVISQLLRLRRLEEEIFRNGLYARIAVDGLFAKHIIAFSRIAGQKKCLVVVPRFMQRLLPTDEALTLPASMWADTRLEGIELPGRYRDVFSDREIEISNESFPIAECLRLFPAAVLLRID